MSDGFIKQERDSLREAVIRLEAEKVALLEECEKYIGKMTEMNSRACRAEAKLFKLEQLWRMVDPLKKVGNEGKD